MKNGAIINIRIDDIKNIIKKEHLKSYNLDANQPLREEQVVLRFNDGECLVFATDERASILPGSVFTYKSGSEALERFISRLRAANYLLVNKLS